MTQSEIIGRNIRNFRVAKRLTQAHLAKMTNLSANYIGMVERGEKNPSLESFIAILNALKITSDFILSDVLEMGYIVKNSILNQRMEKISKEERERIHAVINALID